MDKIFCDICAAETVSRRTLYIEMRNSNRLVDIDLNKDLCLNCYNIEKKKIKDRLKYA